MEVSGKTVHTHTNNTLIKYIFTDESKLLDKNLSDDRRYKYK